MTKRFKMTLSILAALIMVFAVAIPASAEEPVIRRVPGQNDIFLGTSAPEFVLFSDGQVGTVGGGQNIVVWTPSGTGDWDAIKASIIAARQAPGWLRNGNYTFHGFFSGVGFANGFWGQQNHYFSVEYRDGRWYATKRNLAGNLSGTISNTIIFGDPINGAEPLLGDLEVTVGAQQTTITTTRVETWLRTYQPTYTLNKYVSPGFSSVTATTPDQWALRTCPTVINERNSNSIHNGNVVHALTGATYNPLVVRNANSFTFASLCATALAAGEEIPLVLVVGNKFNQVGSGVVTYANGYLTITFDHELFSGSWGAVSFNRMIGVPNNGNIHSIGGNVNNTIAAMNAIGASTTTSFSHNIRENTVTIPAAAPTAAGNIYLYIHGSFAFIRGTSISDRVDVLVSTTFVSYEMVEVSRDTDLNVPTGSAVITVTNAAGVVIYEGPGPITLKDLPIGTYRVDVVFEGQELYQFVNVVAGATASASFNFTLADIVVPDGRISRVYTNYYLPPITNTVIVRVP